MKKTIAWVATPVEASVLRSLIANLEFDFYIGVEDDAIVIMREEY